MNRVAIVVFRNQEGGSCEAALDGDLSATKIARAAYDEIWPLNLPLSSFGQQCCREYCILAENPFLFILPQEAHADEIISGL
jgi:hypothetical protein